jgi:hypothetical protein
MPPNTPPAPSDASWFAWTPAVAGALVAAGVGAGVVALLRQKNDAVKDAHQRVVADPNDRAARQRLERRFVELGRAVATHVERFKLERVGKFLRENYESVFGVVVLGCLAYYDEFEKVKIVALHLYMPFEFLYTSFSFVASTLAESYGFIVDAHRGGFGTALDVAAGAAHIFGRGSLKRRAVAGLVAAAADIMFRLGASELNRPDFRFVLTGAALAVALELAPNFVGAARENRGLVRPNAAPDAAAVQARFEASVDRVRARIAAREAARRAAAAAAATR